MTAPLQPDHIVVLTTLEDAEQARSLVRRLVDDRLVACGTVLDGAQSIYRWHSAVEQAREAVVLLKTRRERWEALATAVKALHPYDVPELLAIPVERGLDAYLNWVTQETSEQ